MGIDALMDKPPQVVEPQKLKPLNRLFSGWAAGQGFNLVAGARWEDGIEIQGGPGFEAPFLGYLIDPPEGAEWSPGIDETKQGILVATNVLPSAIESLRRESYKSGQFVESGGMLFGLHCRDFEGRPYATAQMYIPLPQGARATSASIEFTASALADIHRTVDVARAQYRLSDLVAAGWVHSHPGIAFESEVDTVGHRRGSAGNSTFYGIVIGNELLRRGIGPSQENVARLSQELADRQLHVITSDQGPGSIGLANRVTMAEHYFGKNILEAAEIPHVLEPRERGGVITHGQEPQLEKIVIDKKDLETEQAGSVHVELVEGENPTIVLTLDELQEVKIQVVDVNESNLARVLENLKRLFGF